MKSEPSAANTTAEICTLFYLVARMPGKKCRWFQTIISSPLSRRREEETLGVFPVSSCEFSPGAVTDLQGGPAVNQSPALPLLPGELHCPAGVRAAPHAPWHSQNVLSHPCGVHPSVANGGLGLDPAVTCSAPALGWRSPIPWGSSQGDDTELRECCSS